MRTFKSRKKNAYSLLSFLITSTPSLKSRYRGYRFGQIKRDGTSYDFLGVVDHADYESDISFRI
jgi:hypothetical protein